MKKFVASVLMMSMLASSCVPVLGEEAATERHYIEPTWVQNQDGPTIGTTVKSAIEVDGKFFKDSNGNGELDVYEDWRLDDETRAKDLVTRMSVDEKIGMMVINSRGMGINVADKSQTSMDGLLEEIEDLQDTSIFGTTSKLGTVDTIQKLHLRHLILRQNPAPADFAQWINALNQVAEETPNGIPVIVDSNSRNENAKATFGMNDASGVFSTWPGTLGLASAAMGDIKAGGDAQLITDFAEISRAEWDACGIKKGYMYMADVMTDPRWQRTYGTLGERPEFVTDAIGRLVEGFQGGKDGVQENGVALTVKHFPGGGARENGFDPHYSLGQWNPYPTENSLETYHLAPFQAAVDRKVSSIMPYYAKPYGAKSAPQVYQGMELDLSEAVGFAFNKAFIGDLLRDKMGHEGYINSDSGIIGNMAWGMYDYDVPVRAAYAINAGTDIISDTNDVWSIKEAYRRGVEEADKYPPEHVLSIERIDEANVRLLKEMFATGLFENPYRDLENAEVVVAAARADERVYKAHQKSVVLLKNADETLPLTAEKLEGKRVYVEYFNQEGDTATITKELRNALIERGMAVVGDYNKADYALLFVDPTSGAYFSATAGYLELDICDGKVVVDVDTETGVPVDTTHEETTLKNAGKIAEIAEAVHANGGKVITNVNFQLAWMMGNVEPHADALLAGFDTFTDATIDVITGVYNPTGVLPITLPRNDAVIAVNENGDCVSPNDVPGYAKDQYMPDELKDENGKAYAYRDSEGNYYESEFGLSF
ncbi:MAG: glycoside hydrolase family 3 N-terminal domain-containing protein [Christensenellales bacterium]|nr:glycoside hydrolase family 3 N-terminal domain-containing protein [Christensenellales bacterium]